MIYSPPWFILAVTCVTSSTTSSLTALLMTLKCIYHKTKQLEWFTDTKELKCLICINVPIVARFIILTLHLTSSRARPSQRKDNNHLTTGRFLSTDFCSTLKITDPSNQKICCTVFSEKLDNHPKIFQIGDIIRMHRVKVRITNTDYSSSHVLYYQIKNTFILFRNFDDRKLESKTSETSSVVLQMWWCDEWFHVSLHRLSSSMTPSRWSTLSVSPWWRLTGRWVDPWSREPPAAPSTSTRRTIELWRSWDLGPPVRLSSPRLPQSLCLPFSPKLTSTWPASCWPELTSTAPAPCWG